MFSLVTSFFAGWQGKIAAAVVALTLTFGGGYYTCDHMHAAVAAKAVIVAAKAQETHDKKMHDAATSTSRQVAAQDAGRDAKVVTIVKTIHDLEPGNTCVLSPDVARQLNGAGAAP